MNRENLQKMADYIRAIPQDRFDMELYRKGQHKTPECDSVGCIIGHCTMLDTEPLPRSLGGKIMFVEWSYRFTLLDLKSWFWCFDSNWEKTDNTPEGAALRIEWLLNHGLPEDFFKQMYGEAPICYK